MQDLTYSQSEINVYALDSLNDVDSLNITLAIDSGNIQNIDYSPQGKYIYFSYSNFGIYKAGRCKESTVNYDIVTSNAGDLRRGADGKMYITNVNEFKRVNYPDTNLANISVADVNILPTFVLTGGMPIQRHNISNGSQCSNGTYTRQLTHKNYELTDHLGNVRVVVNDVKEPRDSADYTKGFEATPVAYYNYHSFGMLQPQRNYNAQEYKWGFNGKENDNEVYGITGSWQDYGERPYNPLIIRFPTPDPLIINKQKYPWYSPYQFAGLNPIRYIDLDGLEPMPKASQEECESMIELVKWAGDKLSALATYLDAEKKNNDVIKDDNMPYPYESMIDYDIDPFQGNINPNSSTKAYSYEGPYNQEYYDKKQDENSSSCNPDNTKIPTKSSSDNTPLKRDTQTIIVPHDDSAKMYYLVGDSFKYWGDFDKSQIQPNLNDPGTVVMPEPPKNLVKEQKKDIQPGGFDF